MMEALRKGPRCDCHEGAYPGGLAVYHGFLIVVDAFFGRDFGPLRVLKRS